MKKNYENLIIILIRIAFSFEKFFIFEILYELLKCNKKFKKLL